MEIRDMISGVIVHCRNRGVALLKAAEMVKRHNSTFAYAHRGIHYPRDAYTIEMDNVIYIYSRSK